MIPPYSEALPWPAALSPFQPFDTSIQARPYAHYAWMRDHAPVLRTQSGGGDIWFLSRYTDVRSALSDSATFSSHGASSDTLRFVLTMDPPDHTRIRKILGRAFHAKSLEALFKDRIERIVHHEVESLLTENPLDPIGALAVPMALLTIAEILDMPTGQADDLKIWCNALGNYMGRLGRGTGGAAGDKDGFDDFCDAIRDALFETEREGRAGIALDVVRAWRKGELSETEAVHFCAFLFAAGFETSALYVGHVLLLLAEHPAYWARLKQAPSDIPRFMEEVVRYWPSVQRLTRTTTTPVSLHGYTIPAGSVVKLLVGAANRDPRYQPDAESFNMDRPREPRHLGFGFGIHGCLGAPIVRMEVAAMLQALLERFDGIVLDRSVPVTPFTGSTFSDVGPWSFQARFLPMSNPSGGRDRSELSET